MAIFFEKKKVSTIIINKISKRKHVQASGDTLDSALKTIQNMNRFSLKKETEDEMLGKNGK